MQILSVSDVISAVGGASRASQICGVSLDAVRKWREKGWVPPKNWPNLVRHGGDAVTYEALEVMWRGARPDQAAPRGEGAGRGRGSGPAQGRGRVHDRVAGHEQIPVQEQEDGEGRAPDQASAHASDLGPAQDQPAASVPGRGRGCEEAPRQYRGPGANVCDESAIG